MVTRGGSRTKFQAVLVRRNEIQLIQESLGEINLHLIKSAYCDVWRVFDDFTIDLVIELAASLNKPEFDRWRLGHSENLLDAYKQVGLSFFPNSLGELNQSRVRYAVALARFQRNAIEHRDGVVDQKALDKWTDKPNSSPPFSVGQVVSIDMGQLGDLANLAESFAEDLDKRAIRLVGFKG